MDDEQLEAIARGLQAANARPGGLQLRVFTGYPSWEMAAVLAEPQGSSQHLTRQELQPARCNGIDLEGQRHSGAEALRELLPQLQQLQVLTLKASNDLIMLTPGTFQQRVAARTISVAHLSHLTSLKLENAFVSSSEDLPSSLQQLQLDPLLSIKPLMQLSGLRSLDMNVGLIKTSSERQQLLEQLAVQCTNLTNVGLDYCIAGGWDQDVVLQENFLERAEMAAWAKLPVCMLHLEHVDFVDQQAVQLFPRLLAATHQHLTELRFHCPNKEIDKRLPEGLGKHIGLSKLHLNIGMIPSSSERQQLLEQLAAQCTNLREVHLEYKLLPVERVPLEGGEMAAWALLPLHSLSLMPYDDQLKVDQQSVQLFPKLLAATHKHLTELRFCCTQKDVAEALHEGLAQLTGLQVLDLDLPCKVAPSGVEQLCEVVGAQLENLRDLRLRHVHVSHAAAQHLSASHWLTRANLYGCSWDEGVVAEFKRRFEEQEGNLVRGSGAVSYEEYLEVLRSRQMSLG